MKKQILIISAGLFLTANTCFGQEIPQSQVPSVVANNFQKTFPKASDIEWKIDGDVFKVEFETDLSSSDHAAWFDKMGKLVKHKEEISKNDLPQAVLTKINSDFSSYRVDDVKKITEENKVTYTFELEKLKEEWKVAFDASGNLLSKVAD